MMRPFGHAWACPCRPCAAFWEGMQAQRDAALERVVA